MSEMSDRELDALVAERVMNLVPCDAWKPMNFGSAGGPALRKNCDHDNCYPVRELGSVNGTVGGVPRFSSRISAAMEVLATFQAKKWMWSLNGSSEGGFWCVLYPPLGVTVESVTVDSPAKAICLAALAATEEK